MRIGIDLGTTNTVASFIDENGIWNCLEFRRSGSSEDIHFLPSRVACRDGMIVAGRAALETAHTSPGDVIYDAKANMSTPDKQYFIGGMTVTAREASAHILREVYSELSSQFPSEREFNAFVTVPTGFMTEARLATKTALMDAGFTVDDCCLTDEPIAAAVAYSTRLDGDRLVLVVDIGGGTFDLSLLRTGIVGTSVTADRLEPVGHGRDMHLGGNDVDDLLVRAMAQKFVKDGGADLDHPVTAVFRDEHMSEACRRIRELTLDLKKQLYSGGAAYAYIRELYDGKDLDFTLTQEEYRHLMSEISVRYQRCLDNVFVGTGYNKSQVDHVLVVGGMAHETCLVQILSQMFGKERLIIPEDAMYMVSKGASICNSQLRLQIENRAYTSIGLLTESGRAVENIISEGDIVRTGQILTAVITPDTDKATSENIRIVEYTGKFDPMRCTVILSGSVPVSQKKGLFSIGRKRASLLLEAVFSEDKILSITVSQNGRRHRLDVRLGGKYDS